MIPQTDSGWKDRHVLVTGSAGFIGQHLSRKLTSLGARVYAGVFPEIASERIDALPESVTLVPLDVRDEHSVEGALSVSEPSTVFHLAAMGATDAGIAAVPALETNTLGTIQLLEAVRDRSIDRLILVGTCAEYGEREDIEGLDPINFYAASKAAAWAFARAYWRLHDVPVVTARLFQVYGPGQPFCSLVPAAIRSALGGEDFAITPGEQARDFIYVDDVVDGLLAAAMANGVTGQSVDLGRGRANTVVSVVKRIWELIDPPCDIQVGALPYRPGVVMRLVADADRTARLIGWRAETGLEEGLRLTVRAVREEIE